MKKLLIKIFRSSDHVLKETIICHHMDATNKTTALYGFTIVGLKGMNKKEFECYTMPAEIDHWNLIDGLITIYYKTGFEMEISRITQS
jgi:hypothetical protein